MVDAKAETLELSIAGRDFEINQSPGVLQSSRGGGTTGAAVWQASVKFAEWLAWSRNPLFETSAIDSSSIALELGAGISGLVPCLLGPRVSRMVVTDQSYILKAIRENVARNTPKTKPPKNKKVSNRGHDHDQNDNIEVLSLDWENDDIPSVLSSSDLAGGVDLLMACDCIFNYALIQPLVQTFVDICRIRKQDETSPGAPAKPTLCLIAQQLRQPEVFEQWLEAFHEHFRTWRLPDEMLTADLREGSGFVIHIGVLRGQDI